MPRYKITIEYDGTGMVGWQRQRNPNSVQQILEDAILQLSQQKITVHGSGRTDAGVHAYGQVAHFDLIKNYHCDTILKAINYYTKNTNIIITSAEIVDTNFHARFSAKSRKYKYIIINRNAPLALEKYRAWHLRYPLNLEEMQEAAKFLIGKYDFTSFRAKACQAKSAIKTIDNIEIIKINNTLEFFFTAPSFLHHMVRNIVGSLVLVGKGQYEKTYIQDLLITRDRAQAGMTAPSHGLYFLNVLY